MKKLLLTLCIVLLPTACVAGEGGNPQVMAIKQRCDELTKETGEEYLYVGGRGESIKIFIPPTCHPPYPGQSSQPKRCSQEEQSVQSITMNINSEIFKFSYTYKERPPIFLSLKEGDNYGFCFREVLEKNKRITFLGVPKTVELLGEK